MKTRGGEGTRTREGAKVYMAKSWRSIKGKDGVSARKLE